jgi:CRISPR system Cascade subunit CasE
MSLHLSLLTLNVRHRRTREAIADLTAAHRLVCSGFEELSSNESGRLLWRWEPGPDGGVRLLVQSAPTPNWSRVADGLWSTDPMVKDISALRESISRGRRYRFALAANPTRKIDTKTGPDGKRRHGRRVPLRRLEDQLAWLNRHGIRSGFTIPVNQLGEPEVTATAPALQTGSRTNGRLTVESVRFDGTLVVDEPETLFDSIQNGIGPARAFGCGLLTLAPDR